MITLLLDALQSASKRLAGNAQEAILPQKIPALRSAVMDSTSRHTLVMTATWSMVMAVTRTVKLSLATSALVASRT